MHTFSVCTLPITDISSKNIHSSQCMSLVLNCIFVISYFLAFYFIHFLYGVKTHVQKGAVCLTFENGEDNTIFELWFYELKKSFKENIGH